MQCPYKQPSATGADLAVCTEKGQCAGPGHRRVCPLAVPAANIHGTRLTQFVTCLT